MQQDGIKDHKSMIEIFKKTVELIDFSLQLACSIRENSVKAEHIIKQISVDLGEAEYSIDRDWTDHEQILKDDFAFSLRTAMISFAIIVCKESYAAFIEEWAKKENNPDLYAAEMILLLMRNTLGHMTAKKGELDAKCYWFFEQKKHKDLFEVKSIGVVLDARNLDGKSFEWNHMGGLKNFIKVLKYLEKHVSNSIV